MARVQSITIRRFKRLEEVRLDLAQTTLLIGANNSGKSSILQAIHFAVSIAQSARLVGEDLAWRNDTFELSFNPAQLIYSPVADVLSLACGGTLQESRSTQIEIEFADDLGARCTVGLRRGRNRNIAVSITGRQLGEQLMDLEHPFTVYAPGLAGVPKEERYLSPGVVRRVVARGDANLTLRNVLRMLRADDASWNSFIQDMRSIFDGITVQLTFNENTDENIQARFQLPGGPMLPIDAAGTSILQASQILAYVALFKPRVLILDEPDSHLHPDNQRALCDLIYRLTSVSGFQAVISTHSRHVLDTMKTQSAVFWLTKGTVVQNEDLNATAVLMDLGALDSVDYFADGQLKCVVATEDADRIPLAAVLWSNGFVEADTEIASYTGCTKLDAALVLGNFLATKAPHVRLVVHRDRDYLSPEECNAFAQRLDQANVAAFLTDGNDLEVYFANVQHLAALNPGVTVARVEELVAQATRETADESVKALVNQRTQEAFKIRQRGGPQPDHGEIAVNALADYNADPTRYRRGKIVLGRLQALLQQELGNNVRVFHPSPHLRSQALSQVAATIWPMEA